MVPEARRPAGRRARFCDERTGRHGDYPGTTTGGGTATAKSKSFHGSIQISPSTGKMRLVEIAEEVISVLAGDPNASLNITLEINAEFPGGVSDQSNALSPRTRRTWGSRRTFGNSWRARSPKRMRGPEECEPSSRPNGARCASRDESQLEPGVGSNF